jgi:uncharacterized membrane protein YvbJ
MAKYCLECGNLLADTNSTFCSKCGSKISASALEKALGKPLTEREKFEIKIALIAFVIGLIAGAIYILKFM